MAVRPEISGFHLDKMTALFGSRNEEAMDAIHAKIDEKLEYAEGDWARDLRDARRIVATAIANGVPIQGLEQENSSHIVAAGFLAKYDQRHQSTGSNIWKMSSFRDFFDHLEARFDPETFTLMSYFLKGRPLFGRSMKSEWNYYAFMSLAEVRFLRESIAQIYKEATDITFTGNMQLMEALRNSLDFMEDLNSWLDDIIEDGNDLWFWAQ